ncbi:MAG: DUF488 family protein [Gemmatimonadetes bacterium]|nr:DUF488 domain-containing protein [Gemmatimonadota bacterium]NIR79651.1 DUF488 domain-containing protein [Gemmatimonadota bacterium]NIT88547.1 DUF488 domain-containing protein [Gemmatimonadota bacterium]NIU32364.1 DUF488 domain-containing protein [Gemmatimonadota bacterium]NIU36720.1 DUF488 family protein [Gemmatimonadota bacterium]
MNPIHTVGHSTRSAEALLALLRENEIDLLVDVRRYPASRRHPWFNREALEATLTEAGIDYRHEERLGGRRGTPRPDSPNGGWRNAGFRAYADHMDSEEAAVALARILEDARERRPAIMCAEIVPWRCHRRILSDHLVAAGAGVVHILEPGTVLEHELDALARVGDDGRVIYPPEEEAQGELFSKGERGSGRG